MPVVVMQPALEGVGALCGLDIRARIGPFSQAGLHQPFGLPLVRGV